VVCPSQGVRYRAEGCNAPGGGLLYWGSSRICKERLWRWASLDEVAPLWNLEGGLFTRVLHVEEGSGDGHPS